MVSDKGIEDFLAELEKLGLQITNRQGMTDWFKSKMNQGFSLTEIKDKLKENNYDFPKVDKILNEQATGKQAIKKVEQLETKMATEEENKKMQGKLSMIVTAFMIAIISAGSSWFLSKKIMVDIDTSILGETGGFLNTFVKAGWVVGIAAGFVGLFLVTMMVSEKLKHKKLIPSKEEKTI